MTKIVTLTLNPAVDIACEAEEVRHTRKVRTHGDRMEPGGGGLNVARAINGLGGEAHAIYLAGGPTGELLDALVKRHGVSATRLRIAGGTRVSLNVFDRKTGLEFRFVPEGPCISAAEAKACLEAVAAAPCDYLVASGSLAECLPDSFYADLSDIAAAKTARLVLDTSGPELRIALQHGGLFLVKPSRGELEQLLGRKLPRVEDVAAAALQLVRKGNSKRLAVTLGSEGAVMASEEGACFLPAVPVEACSAVGAGDSFVAAVTLALAGGEPLPEAFRFGMAAGAAAVQAKGTELCTAEDVARLLPMVGPPQPISV